MKGSMRIFCVVFLLLCLGGASCSKRESEGTGHRLRVVATLFPVYDFARQVGGDKVDVQLLLPPGLEPHSFEPKPDDMIRINRADVFVFSNRYMEPWATGLLKGITGKKPELVDAGEGVAFISAADGEHDHGGGHNHDRQLDPHIWLSPPNAEKMVQNIASGFARRDPANSAAYENNAAAYIKKLRDLDARFRQGLSQCRTKTLVHGGHYAFGYLAKHYGLAYSSAYELSANSEPTPRKLMELVNRMKQEKVQAIFYEELVSPAMAEMIARETGASLVKLHGIHTVSRDELNSGVTYMSLMEQNLNNLRKGLECR